MRNPMMPDHALNRAVRSAMEPESPTITTGRVHRVDPIQRVAQTRIGGSPSGAWLKIIDQELTDQLYADTRSGNTPTVRIEQEVIIAYNGSMPIGLNSERDRIARRTFGWYAEGVKVSDSLGPIHQIDVPSVIWGVVGNLKVPSASGPVVIHFQAAWSPDGPWQPILITESRFDSGSKLLSFAAGTFDRTTMLGIRELQAGHFVRMGVSGTFSGAAGLSTQFYIYTMVEPYQGSAT